MRRHPKLEGYKLFYEQMPTKTRAKKLNRKAKIKEQPKVSVFAH